MTALVWRPGSFGAAPGTRQPWPAHREEPVRANGYGWAVNLRNRWVRGAGGRDEPQPGPSAPGTLPGGGCARDRGERRAVEEPSTGLVRRVTLPRLLRAGGWASTGSYVRPRNRILLW